MTTTDSRMIRRKAAVQAQCLPTQTVTDLMMDVKIARGPILATAQCIQTRATIHSPPPELTNYEEEICMLYDLQQQFNELLNETPLYESCEEDEPLECPANASEEDCPEDDTCEPDPALKNPVACNVYGEINDTEKISLDVEVQMSVLYKTLLIIQNGYLTAQPVAGWYRKSGGDWDHAVIEHPATYGRDCPEQGQATVTVNAKTYKWFLPGVLPFKIPEYENKYRLSTDCLDDVSGATYVGSGTNNIYAMAHAVELENSDTNKRHNKGCQTVTATFDLIYYQDITVQEAATTLTSEKLEEMCADNTE